MAGFGELRVIRVLLLTYVFMFEYCICAEHIIRTTNYGKVKGFVEEAHGHKKVEKFFGIPYASPPIGELRLEPPVPPLSWGDILDTTELPAACPQPTEGVAYIEYHVPGFNKTSEDCLFLNIYLPRGSHYRNMPVLVFIHGGSYQNGMGAMFDGSILATHGIVVVTLNYRLGPLGFMSAADDVITGNYGLLDMVQALRWIQENIAHFHGDPRHVTIDGHSAGGCSVGLLLMSPIAKGLFNRVIQQSGSPLAHWSVSRHQTKPDFYYKVFALSVRCNYNSSVDVKRCVKRLHSNTIENVILDEFEWSTSLTPQYRPVVDGYFLPSTPENLITSAQLNADSFLTGATKDEGLIAAIPLIKLFGVGKSGILKLLSLMANFRGDLPEISGIVDSVIDEYVTWRPTDLTDEEIEKSFSEIVGDYFITAPTHLNADILSRRNVSVYLYNYEYRSALEQWDGVIHGAELFYLSGCPFTGHKNFRYDDVDRSMAKVLLLLWSNFIKFGVPSLEPKKSIYMPKYTPDRRLFSRIYSNGSPVLDVSSNLRPEKISFWNEKIPAMYKSQHAVHVNTSCSNSNRACTRFVGQPPATSTWVLVSICVCISVLVWTMALTIGYYRIRRELAGVMRQSSVSSGERML